MLLLFWLTSAVYDFNKLVFVYCVLFSFKNFFSAQMISAFFDQLSDVILSRFNGNIIFMLAFGPYKFLNRIIVQVFHNNIFFRPLCFFFVFSWIGFGLDHVGLLASYCVFRRAEKCLSLGGVLRLWGLNNFFLVIKFFVFSSDFRFWVQGFIVIQTFLFIVNVGESTISLGRSRSLFDSAAICFLWYWGQRGNRFPVLFTIPKG